MKNNLQKQKIVSVKETSLDSVEIRIDNKKMTKRLIISQDGHRYTMTEKQGNLGVVQTRTSFKVSQNKEEKIFQVRQLSQEGYKQNEIADMLGVSQSSVSKYLKP